MINLDESFDPVKAMESQKIAEERLTDWVKEPRVQDFKQELEAAKPSHDKKVDKIKKWNALRDLTGEYAPPKVPNRSRVQPKMVRRQAEWRYPALAEPLLSTDTLFRILPATFEDSKAARQNQLILNYQFRTKIDKQFFVDSFVRGLVDEGTAIAQVGWERTTYTVKEEVPEYSFYPITSPEQLEEFGQALDLFNANPKEFQALDPLVREAVEFYLSPENSTGVPVFAVQTGTREVEVEKLLTNKPTLVLHDPLNVVIDPSCQGDLAKAMFIAVSFETSKSELQKFGSRYKNLDAVDWDASVNKTTTDHETQNEDDFKFFDTPRKRVVANEYWGYYDIDGTGELTPIVATWIGNVMVRMEKNPFPDQKLPFVHAVYMPVKHSVYGEADAELIEENQKIAGAVMRGMVDLMGKSANSQQGIPKGLLDGPNQRRYENGENYEYNPQSGNPGQLIITHTFPEIPASALNMLSLVNQDAESVTGTKAFSGGLSGEAYGQVAAGIKGMINAQGIREMNILRRVTRAFIEIAKKIVAMNAVWLSEKEVVRITNEAYEVDTFEEISRDDLAGNFDFVIDVSTAEMDNLKSQELSFMLQTIGPDMDPKIRHEILAKIADLKRMPDLAERLRKYEPQPDPLQQQLAQLEIEAKQAEIQKIQSEIAYNQARTQQAMANADATTVATSADASGLRHQRELEKQQAQARGNQDLAIQNSITRPRKEGESAPDIATAIGFKQLTDRLDNAQPTSL